jgi:hypothetical protein
LLHLIPLVIPQKFARPREAGWLDAGTTDPKLALRMTARGLVILSASFGSAADERNIALRLCLRHVVILSASFGSAADFWVITSDAAVGNNTSLEEIHRLRFVFDNKDALYLSHSGIFRRKVRNNLSYYDVSIILHVCDGQK